MSANAKYTLRYWAFGGRAQPIRDAFTVGRIQFTDDTSQDFATFKQELPLGQWPVLDIELNGQTTRYCESNAILNYVGKLAGLVPDDPVEYLRVQEILALVEDFIGALTPSLRMPDGPEKIAARKALLEGQLGKMLALLDKRAAANAANSKFLVGKSLTIADLKALSAWDFIASGRLDGIPKETLDNFPAFKLSGQTTNDFVLPLRPPKKQKVAVIGSGTVGQVLAAGFARHAHDVKIATRDAAKLKDFVAKHPTIAVSDVAAAVAWADVVVLAVKGAAAVDAVTPIADALKGKVVLDATNPIDDKKAPQRGVLQFFTGPNESLMERLQSIAKDAKFVKCWSCVGNAMMVNPQYENGRKPTMFICGNDSGAKQLTIQILNQFGWRSADMGFVESARAIEPLCQLWVVNGILFNSWTHAFDMITK